MASISYMNPRLFVADPIRAASRNPPIAYITPDNIYTISIVFATLTPDTLAASGFPPTANRFLPNTVLFHNVHINTIAITAYIIR